MVAVDLNATMIAAFEGEVFKVLRALGASAKDAGASTWGGDSAAATGPPSRKGGSRARGAKPSPLDQRMQAEKKLKEMFEYYKSKMPVDALSGKLLDFGLAMESAGFHQLCIDACYDTVLEAGEGALPFAHTAAAYYRKSVCESELLVAESRGFRTGSSIARLVAILGRVQSFAAKALSDPKLAWVVFNGTVVLYNICALGTAKKLHRIVLPFLIFAIECLDAIEVLYIPQHGGWYVQLCIAAAECCGPALAPGAAEDAKPPSPSKGDGNGAPIKAGELARSFLDKASEKVGTLQSLAQSHDVPMPRNLIKLLERAQLKLALYSAKYPHADTNATKGQAAMGGLGLESALPKAGDRMLSLLLALQQPDRRIVDHYTPEDNSPEAALLEQLSTCLDAYLKAFEDARAPAAEGGDGGDADGEDAAPPADLYDVVGSLFSDRDLRLHDVAPPPLGGDASEDAKAAHDARKRAARRSLRQDRERQLCDCLLTLCKTFYFYEQWDDFAKACKHVRRLAGDGDAGEEGEDGGEDAAVWGGLALRDARLSAKVASLCSVLACCRAAKEEGGSRGSVRTLACALEAMLERNDLGREDPDLALDVALLLCQQVQRTTHRAIQHAEKQAGAAREAHRRRKRAAAVAAKQQRLNPDRSADVGAASGAAGSSPAGPAPSPAHAEGAEAVAVAKQALVCVDSVFRKTDFDDLALRLRIAIQLGVLVERALFAASLDADADSGAAATAAMEADAEAALHALTTAVRDADAYRSDLRMGTALAAHGNGGGGGTMDGSGGGGASPGGSGMESLVSCLQVDAISLKFRVELIAAKWREGAHGAKPTGAVPAMRVAESAIAAACNKNAYWSALFSLQFACVNTGE